MNKAELIALLQDIKDMASKAQGLINDGEWDETSNVVMQMCTQVAALADEVNA